MAGLRARTLSQIRREDPSGILVLAYNRHTAAKIRVCLRRLIGDEARFVTVSIIHALAMRQVGANFAGGDMAKLDPVAQGRVQIVQCPAGKDAQAMAALDELLRLSRPIPDWTWSHAAIISRDWRKLVPVRDFAEALGIPVDIANEQLPGLWRTREMQTFINALCMDQSRIVSLDNLIEMLNAIPSSRWTDRIGEGLGLLAQEIDRRGLSAADAGEWIAE